MSSQRLRRSLGMWTQHGTYTIDRMGTQHDASMSPRCALADFSPGCVSSLESCKRPYVQIEKCSGATFSAAVMAELSRWFFMDEFACQKALETVKAAVQLMCEAGGGALVIIAPRAVLEELHLESTDSGYLSKRLKGASIYSDDFKSVFHDFVMHTDNDRWPDNYDDELARGLPKDGGFLVLPNGVIVKSAAKIIKLPLAPCQWAGHGMRHETAVSVAAHLERTVVLVHSSSGKIRCLLARDRGNTALELKGTLGTPKVAGVSTLDDVGSDEEAAEPDAEPKVARVAVLSSLHDEASHDIEQATHNS